MMTEEIKPILDEAKKKMEETIHFLESSLARIRAGKANPHILDVVKVEYYGNHVPLSNVASITTPDAKTILIQPWEKTMIKTIEKAILNANIGFTPTDNGEVIRLTLPPMTEERRKELVKQVRIEAEEARITIRNARRDVIEQIKKKVKEGLSEDIEAVGAEEAQKLHDNYVKKIDDLLATKEKEIMTV